MTNIVKEIHSFQNITGLIPGVKGQRAFPTQEFRASDPFLMLDHIGPERVGSDWKLNGKGHDHPHRGFETITFMFEGNMHHRDSIGNRVTLGSGSVQRMNAGSGIIHGGDMSSDRVTQRFHEVQLWVNNPASEKMSKPDIHNLSKTEIPTDANGSMILRIISGRLNGLEGPIATKAPTQIAHLISKGKGQIQVGPLSAENTTMIYVLEGEARIGITLLQEYHLALLNDEADSVQIDTDGQSQLLLLSGKPLDEQVAFGGPFVMNTQEEITQAQLDFQQGKFGRI